MSQESGRADKALDELLRAGPATATTGKPTAKERREQADRVRRFRELPPRLQEGLLRCGERIRSAYLTKFR